MYVRAQKNDEPVDVQIAQKYICYIIEQNHREQPTQRHVVLFDMSPPRDSSLVSYYHPLEQRRKAVTSYFLSKQLLPFDDLHYIIHSLKKMYFLRNVVLVCISDNININKRSLEYN